MKELNEIINKNKGSFDVHEPSEDHFVAFQTKMVRKKFYSGVYSKLRYAAAVLMLLTVGSSVTYLMLKDNKVTAMDNQLTEIDYYYSDKVNASMNEFMFLEMNQAEKDMILKEVSNIDSLRTALNDEYIMSGKDPKVEEAIVQHYEMKLRIINRILTKMKKVNQSKTNSYEKDSL